MNQEINGMTSVGVSPQIHADYTDYIRRVRKAIVCRIFLMLETTNQGINEINGMTPHGR